MTALEPKAITGRIYQGGWLRPQHIGELKEIGITHILNLDHPYEDPQPFIDAGFIILNLFIRDFCLMTPQLVREAIARIDASLAVPGQKIYIHCIEGVNRSPTISWLYLIHLGRTPEEASATVTPNPLLYDDDTVRNLIARRG